MGREGNNTKDLVLGQGEGVLIGNRAKGTKEIPK